MICGGAWSVACGRVIFGQYDDGSERTGGGVLGHRGGGFGRVGQEFAAELEAAALEGIAEPANHRHLQPRAALDTQGDEVADAQDPGMAVGLAQRIAGRRMVDDLAGAHRRQPGRHAVAHVVIAPAVLPHAGESGAHHHPGARWQAIELAGGWDRPLPQQASQQPDELRAGNGVLADLGRHRAACVERSQLLLQLEREIVGEQVDLAAFHGSRPCWRKTAESRARPG